MEHLAGTGFKLSVVITRENASQLDEFKAIADRYGAQLRLTRLRPSGRGADVWEELHPTQAQQRIVYDWLLAHGEEVLTGDSFFHLAAYGQTLPGLNLCGAGRVVCLIDPVGDVYACPFAIHDTFLAGNVRSAGGFTDVWRTSELFLSLREPQSGGACSSCGMYDACRGGCMAAKFFTGLPLDGPDPECVLGHGEAALAAVSAAPPKPTADHSRRRARRARVPVTVVTRPCDESPGLMPWFESVAEAERRAKRTLPASVFKAIRAGTERGLTLADNVAAFSELGFAPHVAGLSAARDLSTTVMGVDIALPVRALAGRGAGRAPGGRAGRRPRRRLARHRAGPVGPRQHRDRGGRRRQPEDLRPAVLGGLARRDRGARRARAGGRARPGSS